MNITHACRGTAVGLTLICLVLAGRLSPQEPQASERERLPGSVTLYDPEADHLWNRVHQILFVRTTADGKALGHDEVDPLLWPGTKHLLTGPSHTDAIRILDEFLTRGGDKLVQDPLSRAIMQHDLWTVFEW